MSLKAFRITADGEKKVEAGQVRFGFWTPSAKTKTALVPEGGATTEHGSWAILADDSRVTDFGEMLRGTHGVKGYRRYEVTGRGRRGVMQPGWWWIVSVEPGYSVEQLAKTYRDFWKSPGDLYIEVTGDEDVD